MTNKRNAMPNNYSSGTELEYWLFRHFTARGYTAVRSAGSHTFIDLVVLNGETTFLIQCKSSKKVVDHRQLFRKEEIKLFETCQAPENTYRIIFVKEGYKSLNRYMYVFFSNKWMLFDSNTAFYKDLMEKEGPGYAADRHAKALRRIEKKG